MSGKIEINSTRANQPLHIFPSIGNDNNLDIFGQLFANDLLTCRKVCKTWDKQVTECSKVWEKICERDFPDSLNPEGNNDYFALAKFEIACEKNIRGYQGTDAFYLLQNNVNTNRSRDLDAHGNEVAISDLAGYVHLLDVSSAAIFSAITEDCQFKCVKRVADKCLYGGAINGKLQRLNYKENSHILSCDWETTFGYSVEFLEKKVNRLYVVTKNSIVRSYDLKTTELVGQYEFNFPIAAFQVSAKKITKANVDTFAERFVLVNSSKEGRLEIFVYDPHEKEIVSRISYPQTFSCLRLKQEHLFVGTLGVPYLASKPDQETIVIFDLKTLQKVTHFAHGVAPHINDHDVHGFSAYVRALDVHNQFLFTAGFFNEHITIWNWKKQEKLNGIDPWSSNRLQHVVYSKGYLYCTGTDGYFGVGAFSFRPNVNVPQNLIHKLECAAKALEEGEPWRAKGIVFAHLPPKEKKAIFENVEKLFKVDTSQIPSSVTKMLGEHCFMEDWEVTSRGIVCPTDIKIEAIRMLKEEWEKKLLPNGSTSH